MKFLISCCAVIAMTSVALFTSTASAQIGSRFYSTHSNNFSAPRYSNPYTAPSYSSGNRSRFTQATYPVPQQNYSRQTYSSPSYSGQSYSPQNNAGPALVPTPAGSSRPAYSQNYATQPRSYSTPRKS